MSAPEPQDLLAGLMSSVNGGVDELGSAAVGVGSELLVMIPNV